MKHVAQRLIATLASKGNDNRRLGDAARDDKNWLKAASAYKAHLEEHPDDAAIWTQYGHALKEQGRIEEAEVAYRRALVITPDDADGHLQLGHALKLQGRLDEAAECYARSLELKPTKSAFDEVERLGHSIRTSEALDFVATSPGVDLVFFEVDDLLGYLSAHLTLSGIQRVQVGIIKYILSQSDRSSDYCFVRSRVDGGGFWQMDPDVLRSLINHCLGKYVERNRITAYLNQLEQSATLVKPCQGQCYFVLGAFWGFNGDATRYARLKSDGVSVGVYIYDLIPLTHPEYCDAHLVNDFALSLGDGLAVFDFVICISKYTAIEVNRYIAAHGIKPIPVQSVTLAHVLNDAEASINKNEKWTKAIIGLKSKRFVLSVSTIEARKNHAYLIMVWRLLIQQGVDVPDLVFVGRQGWRVNDLIEQLRATDYMGGRVHILHDLSDDELETLYRNCLFTAFPSYVEGWGLPVGESLAHGKLCVASNTSSIPEVGGDLVDYIDPYNLRAGVEVFRNLVSNPAYLVQREADIRKNFRPRMWKLVGSELLTCIDQLRSQKPQQWLGPLLRPGEIFRPADLRLGNNVPINYPSRPMRLILDQGWYTAEKFGAWMRGNLSTLHCVTDCKPGTEVVIYLEIAASLSHQGANLVVFTGSGNVDDPIYPAPSIRRKITTPIPWNRSFFLQLLANIEADRTLTVHFAVEGDIPRASDTDERRLSAGFVAMAYALRNDSTTRADITDALRGT